METSTGNYFKKFFSEREKKNVIVAGGVNEFFIKFRCNS